MERDGTKWHFMLSSPFCRRSCLRWTAVVQSDACYSSPCRRAVMRTAEWLERALASEPGEKSVRFPCGANDFSSSSHLLGMGT